MGFKTWGFVRDPCHDSLLGCRGKDSFVGHGDSSKSTLVLLGVPCSEAYFINGETG